MKLLIRLTAMATLLALSSPAVADTVKATM
jgi:hypothetical protein